MKKTSISPDKRTHLLSEQKISCGLKGAALCIHKLLQSFWARFNDFYGLSARTAENHWRKCSIRNSALPTIIKVEASLHEIAFRGIFKRIIALTSHSCKSMLVSSLAADCWQILYRYCPSRLVYDFEEEDEQVHHHLQLRRQMRKM